jgi:hypothetical protein
LRAVGQCSRMTRDGLSGAAAASRGQAAFAQ